MWFFFLGPALVFKKDLSRFGFWFWVTSCSCFFSLYSSRCFLFSFLLKESPPSHQGEVPPPGLAGHPHRQLGHLHAVCLVLRALPRARLPCGHRKYESLNAPNRPVSQLHQRDVGSREGHCVILSSRSLIKYHVTGLGAKLISRSDFSSFGTKWKIVIRNSRVQSRGTTSRLVDASVSKTALPHADGKSGEVSQSTEHFWRFTWKQHYLKGLK